MAIFREAEPLCLFVQDLGKGILSHGKQGFRINALNFMTGIIHMGFNDVMIFFYQ